ncbi:MAG: hypothetical protein PHV18_08790 [Lachnospiraceae bacterium]|nr:hypothetical protein [Lachnospiraceae bacterium]
MKQNKKTGSGSRLTEEQRRLLPVIMIPMIVIILMIIIVVADHSGKKAPETETLVETTAQPETMESASAAESESETEETTEAETEAPETDPADAFVTDTLKRDSIPEILDLMKRYFQARAGADAAAMNQIYGVGDVSETQLQEQTARMRSNANYVQEFEHVTTYVMDGTMSDSWLVYSVADIRFHTVKTAAPMIMWCYVMKDAEGNYRIVNDADLSENVQRFIDAANHSEAVRRLASSVNGKLKEALDSDADLNTVYGVLRDGSPVWQEGETEPEVVVLDGTETTAAEGESGEAETAESETTADTAAETTAAQ